MFTEEEFQEYVIGRLDKIESRLNMSNRLGPKIETEDEKKEREHELQRLIEAAGEKFQNGPHNVPTLR